jgi:hypothetical protein
MKQSFGTLHTSVADQINKSMTYPPTKYDQDMNIFLFIHVRMFTLYSNTCMEFKSLFKNTWTLRCTNLPPNLFGEAAEHAWVIHISGMIIYTQYCICTQVLEWDTYNCGSCLYTTVRNLWLMSLPHINHYSPGLGFSNFQLGTNRLLYGNVVFKIFQYVLLQYLHSWVNITKTATLSQRNVQCIHNNVMHSQYGWLMRVMKFQARECAPTHSICTTQGPYHWPHIHIKETHFHTLSPYLNTMELTCIWAQSSNHVTHNVKSTPQHHTTHLHTLVP